MKRKLWGAQDGPVGSYKRSTGTQSKGGQSR